MSITQKFTEMLTTLQQPNSIEYSVITHLSNAPLGATISELANHVYSVIDTNILNDESPASAIAGHHATASQTPIFTSQDLEKLKSQLVNLQSVYHKIEYEAQKLCGLNYSRCIHYAETSNELIIINEIKQYAAIFGNLFTVMKSSIDSLSILFNISIPDEQSRQSALDQLLKQYTEVVCEVEDTIKLYLANADSKLKSIESLNTSASKNNDAKTHYSHIHYSIRSKGDHKHKHLSANDRNELHQIMRISHTVSFNSLLFKYIDETGMTDAQVYKAAGISKQVFYLIRNGKQCSLKKVNVVSICVVLQLNTEKTLRLLACCGYGLSEYITFDRIINFCISRGCYDVDEINELLYEYNQQTICGT